MEILPNRARKEVVRVSKKSWPNIYSNLLYRVKILGQTVEHKNSKFNLVLTKMNKFMERIMLKDRYHNL